MEVYRFVGTLLFLRGKFTADDVADSLGNLTKDVVCVAVIHRLGCCQERMEALTHYAHYKEKSRRFSNEVQSLKQRLRGIVECEDTALS